MQTLNVAQEGFKYLWLCLREYSGGYGYFILYLLALSYIIIKGNETEKAVFVPQSILLALTVYNPFFPMLLNRIFDVNNEYYRFFWITPVVILLSYVMAKLCFGQVKTPTLFFALIAVFSLVIIAGGRFLYKDGYIKSPNVYKMPTEIPHIANMIHDDAKGRYEGDYYPRAICEFDYEMCLRQYDASIMLTCSREEYLRAVTGQLGTQDVESEEEYYPRVLAVMVNNWYIEPKEFKKGLEKTGTEYVCASTANTDLCDYLKERCDLRVVGMSANHTLFHYELQESEGWTLPDYRDVWENY
ncbi:MAG: hypothetical protein IKR56_02080 [Lachnospiraceae bacterium]|nr:hypothetical protein [Lachnospiraceae bacterium]